MQIIHKSTGLMRNQENMTLPKEHNKLQVTDFKEMEIHEFPDKELEIIILKVLREILS